MTEPLSDAGPGPSSSRAHPWGAVVSHFRLGGMRTGLEVEGFCYGALVPSAHDHDVVAHALNERFVELGGNHPVAYSDQAENAGKQGEVA